MTDEEKDYNSRIVDMNIFGIINYGICCLDAVLLKGSVVYAYGGDEMYMLHPGETTTALTEQMTMREKCNSEYAVIDDINFIITGYAISTEDISLIPEEAWEQCKIIEENQY